jgi:hypothetical protein
MITDRPARWPLHERLGDHTLCVYLTSDLACTAQSIRDRTSGPGATACRVPRDRGTDRPIKVAVDLDPTPGRFLLTGSSRVLALRTLPDALPGRMEVIEL